jgi:hypothetical protein
MSANQTQSARGVGLVPTDNRETHRSFVTLSVGAKRFWKEITLAILGLLLFISTFLVPYHLFLPAWRQYNNSYDINPGSSSSFSISTSVGSTVQLMLDVSGEGSLHLSTKNKDGQTVINQNLSLGKYFFDIPGDSGTYSASLENSGSFTQSIYWIVSIYYYNSTFQLIGISFSGLACFMLLAHKKEEEVKEIHPLVKPILIKPTPMKPNSKKNTKNGKKQPSPSETVKKAKKVLKNKERGTAPRLKKSQKMKNGY